MSTLQKALLGLIVGCIAAAGFLMLVDRLTQVVVSR